MILKRVLPALKLFSCTALVAAAAFLPNAAAAETAKTTGPAPRINQPIDDSNTVALKGTVHKLATARNDRGAVDDGQKLERIQLQLKRSDAQEKSLQQQLKDLHTPGSAQYHKWLTPDQFGKQYGPAKSDVEKLTGWLNSHGFGDVKLNPGGQTMEFTGTAGQFRNTFGTELHKYQVNGRTHTANAGDPKLPVALTSVVRGFTSLNNFPLHSEIKKLGKATLDPATHRAKGNWTIGSPGDYFYPLGPGDLAVQYNMNPAYKAGTDGTGQTIGIINEANVSPAIVAQYRSFFGLSAGTFNVIIDGNDPGIDGINNPDGPNGASIEAYLDVEVSGAVAPGATVDLVIAADTYTDSGLYLAAEHAVYGNVAPVLSLSFGGCELYGQEPYVNALWEQAAAQGQTVMVSSGDNGSAGCDDDNTQDYAVNGQNVNGLASSPWDVAVGGTDFYYSDYADGTGSGSALNAQLAQYWGDPATTASSTYSTTLLQPVPEQPWNDSQYGLDIFNTFALGQGNVVSAGQTNIVAGSGGPSNCADPSTGSCAGVPKPSWQKSYGLPNDGVRDLPDVSLFAANGSNLSFYAICAGDGDCQTPATGSSAQFTGVGGTSASSPAFAGVMALVNQKYGPQGQANFVLYPLRGKHPSVYNAVSVGSNSVPCAYTFVDNTNVSDNGGATPDCIAVSNPITDTDPTYGTAVEGQIGNTANDTPDYNAGPAYSLASGLGTVNVTNLINYWPSVSFTGSTVTLAVTDPTSNAALTTFAHGTGVEVSGAVTPGTAGGNVTLLTTSTEPLQASTATFPVSDNTAGAGYSGIIYSLPGGTYTLESRYSGDGTNATSTSAPVTVTVTPENSILNFAIDNYYNGAQATGSTFPYGTQLLLDAQPAPATTTANEVPGPATGTVTFSDNGTTINSATINANGSAEYNSAFAVGTHSVNAAYAGDNSYNASSATANAFTITQDTPIIILSTGNSYHYQVGTGAAVNAYAGATALTVGVENSANLQFGSGYNPAYTAGVATPTGVVTLTGLPGGTLTFPALVGSRDLYNQAPDGAALLPLGNIAAGSYTVTISYPGDANYAAYSGTITLNVLAPTGISTTTTVTTSQPQPNVNSAITVTVTVTGSSAAPATPPATGTAAPTGYLYFFSSGAYLAAVELPTSGTGNTATVSFNVNSADLLQGDNVVTVQYSGDSNYAPSYASSTLVSEPGAIPAVTVSAPAITVTPGNSATASVTVTPVNGFVGQVSLACSVAAASNIIYPPTCSVSAPSAITGSGPVTATLTINTTAPSSSATTASNKGHFGFAPFGGIAAAALLFFLAPVRRRRIASLFVAVLMLAGAGMVVGCGSSVTSPTFPAVNPGTPAGTYQVTVTATANGIAAATTTVTITVQ